MINTATKYHQIEIVRGIMILTSICTESTNLPFLQRSKLSKPTNQSGEGTSFDIKETCKVNINVILNLISTCLFDGKSIHKPS